MRDIYDLLKKGILFGVSVGSSEADILSVFKRKRMSRINTGVDNRGPIALSLKGFEFHLFDNQVVNIIVHIKSYMSRREIEIVVGSPKFPINGRSNIDMVIKVLRANGIKWEFYPKYTTGKRVELITEGSATIEFLAEDEGLLINRIHRNDKDIFKSHDKKYYQA